MFNSVGSRSATAYRKIGVETQVDQADPHALVEMLFDGLMLAVGMARAALQRGDISDEGLRGCLNLEKGGELAGNLHDLYQYCVMRLTQANARNDDAALAEVQNLLEPISTGWKQMGVAISPSLKAA